MIDTLFARARRALGVVALAAGAAACGSAAGAPAAAVASPLAGPEPAAPPAALEFSRGDTFFVPGEQMQWAVSYMGVAGGRSGLAVGTPGTVDGRRALIVRTSSRSDGLVAKLKHVNDRGQTQLDLDTALPIQFEAEVEFGDRRSHIVTHFDPPRVRFAYRRNGKKQLRWTQRLPAGSTIHNMHSAIGALRAWRPRPGETAAFYAVSGRRLYRVSLRAVGADTRDTPLGRLPCFRVDGTASRLRKDLQDDPRRAPRVFSVWISDDVNRLPVWVEGKTEYGDVTVSLIGYRR